MADPSSFCPGLCRTESTPHRGLWSPHVLPSLSAIPQAQGHPPHHSRTCLGWSNAKQETGIGSGCQLGRAQVFRIQIIKGFCLGTQLWIPGPVGRTLLHFGQRCEVTARRADNGLPLRGNLPRARAPLNRITPMYPNTEKCFIVKEKQFRQ